MPKPLRIAHVVGNLETGGTQTLIMELMRRLDRARFDSSIIYFKDPNHFAEEITGHGWRCTKVRASRSYRMAEILEIAKVLRREKFDIVHTHSDFANFAGRAAAIHAGIPRVIAHYHNTYEHRLDETFKKMERHLAPRTDAFIACSKGVEEFMPRNLDLCGRPLFLLQNGVDLTPFRAAAQDRAGIRQRLGISPGTFHIVHTARLEPHKTPSLVLQAAAALGTARLGDWRLTYVGGGSLRQELEAFAAKDEHTRDRVHFAGWCKNVAEWVASGDAFCLFSSNEGLPLSLVEAMAAGTPSLASDIVGPREVIENGVSGILVKPGDVAQMAGALARVKENPTIAGSFSSEGKKRAELFSIENFVARAEEIYDAVSAQPVIHPPMNALSKFSSLFRFSQVAKKRRKKS